MKRGLLISVLLAVLSAVGLGVVMVMNASPYVDVLTAKLTKKDGLHVAGKIDVDTIVSDPRTRTTMFMFGDKTGTVPVIYTGPSKGSLQDATQVVVIGRMEGNNFVARDMLVKCPSKYESEKGAPNGKPTS